MPNYFDDLDDREFDAISSMSADELAAYKQIQITQAAHIVNGGEAEFPCPACNGTGRWGYAGRPCYKCKSTGKVSKAVAGAAKGKQTKATNFQTWSNENADLITRMEFHLWNKFVKSMYDQITVEQRALSENQLIAVTDAVNRYDAQNLARREAAEQARIEKSGTVNLSAVHALFTKATDNGYKRPIFRSKTVTVKMARRHENRLYVTNTNDDTYLGKIEQGTFYASNEATPETLGDLRLICDDPEKALFNYSRSTATYDENGNMISCGCGICGKELTDPISMARGIGPICAEGFGL